MTKVLPNSAGVGIRSGHFSCLTTSGAVSRLGDDAGNFRRNRAWPLARVRALGSVIEAGVTIGWVEGQAPALHSADLGAGAEVGNVRLRDATGRDVVHDIPFACAFHAFFPDGQWMLGN